MTLSCIAPRCALPRRHIPGCDGTDCRGCLPALAEPNEAFCDTCSSKLRRWLGEIPDLFAAIVDPPTIRDEHTVVDGRPHRDPIAYHLPAGSVPGATRQPRVSGSPEDQLPARYNEAGAGSMRVRNDRGQALDQVGDPPPAVLLDSWARDWQTYLHDDLPPATVAHLCRWFTARLDWALRSHPAMDDFHAEINTMHARLWTEAGRHDARPELCVGVPCRRCDLLSLWRNTDGSGDVECHNPDCRTLYRADEYREWLRLVTAPNHREWLATKLEAS